MKLMFLQSKKNNFPLSFIFLRCAPIGLLLALTGCSLFRTPFAIDAGSIDEESPQTAARIRLSPPQIFTRERLINDRLQEKGFLMDQLRESATVALSTSLARDLRTISALAADLSLSIDPAIKLNFQNSSQQADLQQQINVVQLQGQLLTVQNQLKALEAGTGPGPAALTAAPSTTVQPGIDTQASDDRIEKLHDRLEKTMGQLATLASTTRDNLLKGTPEDEFEDRLALRARIREAINANELDDVHDIDGNALYHLQFTATLLPGENKSQFGIARVRIEPPQLTRYDVDLLYHTWLAFLTSRMNQAVETKKTKIGNERFSYKILGPLTGLYDVATVKLPRKNLDSEKKTTTNRNKTANNKQKITKNNTEDATIEILVAVPPGYRYGLEFDGHEQHEELKEVYEEVSLGKKENQKELIRLMPFVEAVIKIAPSVEAAVFALGDRTDIEDNRKLLVREELKIYTDSYARAKYLLSYAKDKKFLIHLQGDISGTFPAPDPFCSGLLGNTAKCPENKTVTATGTAYPYSADPVLRSQRVSTIASVANAVDLAAAIRAQVPRFPISLGGASGYSQQAAARADTIERVPQVFGFAGTYDDDLQYSDEKLINYEFGWVFGPKLVLDPSGNKLLLRQNARTEKVSADISIPAWWPRATLHVKTGWKGSFSGDGGFLDEGQRLNKWGRKVSQASEYELPIRFKPNSAAFDALTVKLAQALTSQGFHQARIDKVMPDQLQLCHDAPNKDITLLIYGMDLWRNPKVFYGGHAVDSTSIEILPDMAGIAATIKTSLLLKNVSGETTNLVVWTSHGSVDIPSKLNWQACGGGSSNSSPASALQFRSDITSISPDSDHGGTLRVLLIPSPKVSSITLSAKGAELVSAKLNESLGVSAKLVGGSIKIEGLGALPKNNKEFAVDLTFRNLGEKFLKITATPETEDSALTPVDLSIEIASSS